MKATGWRLLGGTVVVVGLASLAAALPARAQSVARDQSDPDVVGLAQQEEILVVWAEDRGAGPRVLAKRVRANGLPVGGPAGGEWAAAGTADPTGLKGDQRWPAVADGLLVWSERLPGATDFDLYAQRLFSNGRAQGRPTLVAGGPGDQRYGDVAASGDGWLVVWSDDASDGGDVLGRRLSAALTAQGAAFPIAQGPGVAEDPVIGRDPGDPRYFLVLYSDDRNGNRDIYGTRVAQTGLPRGGPAGGQFPVVQSPEDDYAPALAVAYLAAERPNQDSARNVLLWTTDTVTDGPDVLGQRLGANGLPLGRSFTVAGGPGNQSRPGVTLNGPEEWLAVWQADRGGTLDVLSVDVRANGIPRPTRRVLAGD